MSKSAITFGKIESAEAFFNPGMEVDPKKEKFEVKTKEEEEGPVEEEDVKKEEPSLILVDLETEEKTTLETAEEETAEEEVAEIVDQALEDEDVDYKALTLQLINSGMWERFEPEEGVKIEDLEEISKDDFETISKTQTDWKKDEVKTKVLEGLSLEEKEFIDFKKDGGNINQYVQNYMYKQQAQNLEIETDNGKKNAVFSYYKSTTNWSDQKIVKYIDRLEKDLELDSEAKTAKEEIEKITQAEYDKMLAVQADAHKERIEKIREYKKNVRKTLKDNSYDTKKVDAVVKAMTVVDENGYASVDRAYLSYRNDPAKADLLYNMLLNFEEWATTVGQQKVNESNLEHFKRIALNKKAHESSVDEDDLNKEEKVTNKGKPKLVINLPKRKR